MSAQPPGQHTLLRTMGLLSLTIYGVGDMLGSGVYALMGTYAATMGNAIWVAFLGSMLAAGLTGLSYASLGSRYPRAAGAAYVVQRAYRLPLLSYMIGLATIASGLTSMATQSHAFAGYFEELVTPAEAAHEADSPANDQEEEQRQQAQQQDSPLVPLAIALAFIAALTLVNFWGMRQSTWLNVTCTVVEVGGLAIVVAVGIRFWGGVDYLETPQAAGGAGGLSPLLVMQGAVLTFFAFIGFEDMLNVSEEVKDPRRTFPRALVLAVAVVTLIYMAVAVTAVSVVPHARLAESDEPLVSVVRIAAPWFPTVLYSGIALFAITNTALLNYIMGSRLVYGMARQGLLPPLLGSIHRTRRTPHVAIGVLMLIVVALALIGELGDLAAATSLLLLCVFSVANIALVVLKFRPNEPRGGFEVPTFVPILGALVCATLVVVRVVSAGKFTAPLIAGAMLAGIALLYFIHRPKAITEELLEAVEHAD